MSEFFMDCLDENLDKFEMSSSKLSQNINPHVNGPNFCQTVGFNIQLWPSLKVKIHNYYIDERLFTKVRRDITLSKFDNYGYNLLFMKNIMVLSYYARPNRKITI